MAARSKCVRLEEAIDFVLNSDNSDWGFIQWRRRWSWLPVRK